MKVIDFTNKVNKFLRNLDSVTETKAIKIIDLLKKYGHELRMPYSKNISNNLFELRIRGKQEVRIFYCFFNNNVILLHYFIKKTQKIPSKEIKLAKTIRDKIKYYL
jgi:phage-related protein